MVQGRTTRPECRPQTWLNYGWPRWGGWRATHHVDRNVNITRLIECYGHCSLIVCCSFKQIQTGGEKFKGLSHEICHLSFLQFLTDSLKLCQERLQIPRNLTTKVSPRCGPPWGNLSYGLPHHSPPPLAIESCQYGPISFLACMNTCRQPCKHLEMHSCKHVLQKQGKLVNM
jgi:hypothetical protein